MANTSIDLSENGAIVSVKELIKRLIYSFVHYYSKSTSTKWRKPLVAFADADDPLFLELKKAVRPSHALPQELLEDAETVIVYFIPFVEEIAYSNSGGEYASREWALAYIETNKLIVRLNRVLARRLEKLGYKSKTLPPTHNFDEETLISDWSHKHVAYIAGLGKFGLHKMIITEKGCCGRLGSLITNAEIKPTPRPRTEYCLYFYDKSCKACVDKCKFGALTLNSFDRFKCYEICLRNFRRYRRLGLAGVCGKCVCVVPCSFKNPVKRLKNG